MHLTKQKEAWLLIAVAFIFSIAVRMIWVNQFADVEQFKFNNEFMINTNDGYLWAEGARDILNGTHQEHDRSPIDLAASQLTAFIAKVLPFSFETVIFYLPAFLSSLIIIPIILIGYKIKRVEVGFIAALLSSIAWSYYNRTMVGYYDTDMLNIVFPTLLLWSLIWAVDTKEKKYLLFTALDIFAYRWWYPQSYALEFAFFGLIGLYLLYILYKERSVEVKFYENETIVYIVELLTLMLLAMSQLDLIVRVILVFAYLLLLDNSKVKKYFYLPLFIGIALFLAAGGFKQIMFLLSIYVFKSELVKGGGELGLHFFSVMQTVREAGQIPFETFANRISGHTYIFIASIVGYIWLAYKNRIMLLGLPMIGLGFLALTGGLRFTIYAIPVLALGVAYLIYEVSSFLSKQFINEKVEKVMKYSFLLLFTVVILYPNIEHVKEYKVPPVFTKNIVKTLDDLKNIADREDYVVAWWDYGFPIRYYSDVKTLLDGGAHTGSVNFPVSYILTHPQKEAANMMRLDVEYNEKRFHLKDENKTWESSNIAQMTLDYGFKDTNVFLKSLNKDIKLPKKTRDVYLFLPYKMMGILPTITLFSNLDLMNGKAKKRPFFYQTSRFKQMPGKVNLGSGIFLNNRTGEVTMGKNRMRLHNFIVTQYDGNGKLHVNVQKIDNYSPVNIIFMKSYNTFLVLDNQMLNSTFIQLFVLENYDKKLFEKVIMTPQVKIFKLKNF